MRVRRAIAIVLLSLSLVLLAHQHTSLVQVATRVVSVHRYGGFGGMCGTCAEYYCMMSSTEGTTQEPITRQQFQTYRRLGIPAFDHEPSSAQRLDRFGNWH